MTRRCENCGRVYGDAAATTICPQLPCPCDGKAER